jgi:NAD+ synthase (glutamine-hydrolysing)
VRLIKLGIASIDATVGAFRSNTDRLIAMVGAMAAEDVTIACFQEQVLGGYPPEDLVQWPAFLDAQREALERVRAATAALSTVVVLGIVTAVDGDIFNVAAVLHAGRVLGLVPKEKLPTYEVFYEARTLSRGTPGLALDARGVPLGDYIFGFDFGTLAVEICEDSWTPDGPMRRRCFSGAEIVISPSASPYRVGFHATRREMFATRSRDNEALVVNANAVGAQDALVFGGGGSVFQNGRLVLETPRFREGWWSAVVDMDRTRRRRRQNTTWRTDAEAFRAGAVVPLLRSDSPTADATRLRYPAPAGDFYLPPPEPRTVDARAETLDDLFEAMVLGLAGYVRKTGAFRGIGVALSGGRDSLLSLLVAWASVQRLNEGPTPPLPAAETIAPPPGPTGETTTPPPASAGETGGRGEGGAYWLRAFYMPSRHSLDSTAEAARTIAAELGVPLEVVPIQEAVEREIEAARAMLGGEEPDAITVQNIQARIRGTRMWNWANSAGGLFLQTGDMSEKAVGYTTIGGDLEGGYSPIANVPKTVVVALLERLHERFGFDGIRRTLETEAGPELADDQTAEGELMPFRVLDACLYLFAGEKMSAAEVAAVLPDVFPDDDPAQLRAWAERFATLFTRSIYKWVRAPMAVHVGRLDLDRERALQLPVVQEREDGL